MDKNLFNEDEFLKTYRGSEKFIVEGEKYFKLFLELLEDDDLLEKIKFANDVLGVPPLTTFILYERDYLKKPVFSEMITESFIKQGLGACFGYLYRFIYKGYEPVQCWFNDELTGIKTVSKFVKKHN